MVACVAGESPHALRTPRARRPGCVGRLGLRAPPHRRGILAVILGFVLPRKYRSGTLILVESKSLPESFVTPVTAEGTAQRLNTIRQVIMSRTRLERVIHLRTLHLGPETLLVTAKIAVRPHDQAEQIAAGIDAAERRVRAAVPIAKVIYLEPDLYREARADTTDPAIRAVRRRQRR